MKSEFDFSDVDKDKPSTNNNENSSSNNLAYGCAERVGNGCGCIIFIAIVLIIIGAVFGDSHEGGTTNESNAASVSTTESSSDGNESYDTDSYYTDDVEQEKNSGKIMTNIGITYGVYSDYLSDKPDAEFFLDGKSIGIIHPGDEGMIRVELEVGKTYTLKASTGLFNSDKIKFTVEDNGIFGSDYIFEYDNGKLKRTN